MRATEDEFDPAFRAIVQNLAALGERIARAARAAGREAAEVTLLAVSKTQPEAAVRAALGAGQWHFGENRVQEAQGKFARLEAEQPRLRLHLIGPLQTNKARLAVRVAHVIESLDRPKLADAIADAVQKEGRSPELLVEVNVGEEPQKSGVPKSLADPFIAACRERFGLSLVGLMCVPPALGDPVPYFTWLAAAARRHGLAVLSMGMSADFEAAIAAGATEVRIGSAIFGAR